MSLAADDSAFKTVFKALRDLQPSELRPLIEDCLMTGHFEERFDYHHVAVWRGHHPEYWPAIVLVEAEGHGQSYSIEEVIGLLGLEVKDDPAMELVPYMNMIREMGTTA